MCIFILVYFLLNEITAIHIKTRFDYLKKNIKVFILGLFKSKSSREVLRDVKYIKNIITLERIRERM